MSTAGPTAFGYPTGSTSNFLDPCRRCYESVAGHSLGYGLLVLATTRVFVVESDVALDLFFFIIFRQVHFIWIRNNYPTTVVRALLVLIKTFIRDFETD